MKHVKNYPRSSARWCDYARPSTRLTIVAIMTIVLCLTSCATKRTHQEFRSQGVKEYKGTDSTLAVTEIRRQGVSVPASSVSLTLSADSLQQLPTGAVYTEKSGQARVTVKTSPDPSGERVIVVEATCDSLQLVCEEYERTIASLSSQVMWWQGQNVSHGQDIREPPSNGVLTAIKWLAIGIFAGIFLKGIKN